ncbi:hypothetical protein F0562_032870 [Nyssa sinensis]|uniref:Pectate lyase n=1 Tax=Nyssa sinensis TaxID=561372 RepID=A0A5J5APT9_9ASTE|nr:hypothetical protein F0562_032870 [Nyssa sinensis]
MAVLNQNSVLLFFFVSFASMIPTFHAHIAVFDEYWQNKSLQAYKTANQLYRPNPEEITDDFNKKVARAVIGSNNTRRNLKKYTGACKVTNPIDRCWRCRSDWATDRKRLGRCAMGFGRNTIGGLKGKFYVVTDPRDDSLEDPRPGTLRHAVIQKEPLWIIFQRPMIIRLTQELIMASDKTIDARGANVHIAYGAGITIQFINNVIIHGLHIHDIVVGTGGLIRDSVDHIGLRTKSDGDGISIFGSTNVWIDHVSMARCTDGLIDAIMGSTAITISNCHFTEHNEVTKRDYAMKGEWMNWQWRSEGDLTMNGAFFVESGQPLKKKPFSRLDMIKSKPEMEMSSVKSEMMSSGRRRLCMVEGDVPVAKCVKRRRRDPSAVALGCNDPGKQQQLQLPPVDQPSTVKRSSRFRGVSRHRWTGRFEAHLWDKGSWNATQRKKGKQGAYDEEESAARAYDLAAIKYWGSTTFTNFPASDYEKEIEIMQNVTKEEYLASLRRRSSGFSRGVSKYRGVARHHHNGRWEARIGRVFGNKYLYLGTYSTQEEAAHAYDIAAIEYRGINAVTNFDLSTYIRWLKPGANAVASQDPRPNIEIENLPVQVSSNRIPSEEPELIFQANSYTTGNFNIPQKQEVLERKMPISPCNKSSSPTALSLLLRSSMYRDLMERNSNVIDEETEGNDTKNQSQTGSEDEFGGFFYNGIGNSPYVSSSNGDMLPGLEPQEENALSLYNRTGQSLWNGSINMPSSIH